ncbi:hypothetical protein [Rhizobium rhizogenes]|uniref:hypothetical protein n=1 Tax=Rhizobium rhizogenes TaxID=359 RepID=UPI0022C747C8|nr:hypothetical protein [Rhizobium rhizogenes]MCZ7483221.1 hypothetical protein [Rhizobium rhizogenes]
MKLIFFEISNADIAVPAGLFQKQCFSRKYHYHATAKKGRTATFSNKKPDRIAGLELMRKIIDRSTVMPGFIRHPATARLRREKSLSRSRT